MTKVTKIMVSFAANSNLFSVIGGLNPELRTQHLMNSSFEELSKAIFFQK